MAKKIVALSLVEPYRAPGNKQIWKAHPTSGMAWKDEPYIDSKNAKKWPHGLVLEQGPAGVTLAVPGERARILFPWAMINGVVIDDEPFAVEAEPAKK